MRRAGLWALLAHGPRLVLGGRLGTRSAWLAQRASVLLFVVSCFLASFWALVSDSEAPASQESPGGSPGQSLLLHRRLASPGNPRRQWIVRLCSYVPDAHPRHSRRSRGSQGTRAGLVVANHCRYCATNAYAGQEYWQQLTTLDRTHSTPGGRGGQARQPCAVPPRHRPSAGRSIPPRPHIRPRRPPPDSPTSSCR